LLALDLHQPPLSYTTLSKGSIVVGVEGSASKFSAGVAVTFDGSKVSHF
jgi:hypothetical protein